MFSRMLYVGDVPVEATYHGSALLYRLLADYPRDRLTILETGAPSDPKRRLPEVNYLCYSIANTRWLNTRLHSYAMAWFSLAGTRSARTILQSVNGSGFDRVLTVAHGFGWLAAAEIARTKRAPLHLMVHDDWPRVARIPAGFSHWLDERFARVYRQSESRMCVSPAMSRDYHKRYGKTAEVVYPSRAPGCADFEGPPARIGSDDKRFTVAFAGTINSNGYVRALLALQQALTHVCGRLLIFGPLTRDASRQMGLDHPNTEVCGLLSSHDLMNRLRAEADALFAPMSFDRADRTNMQMAFPSKLADYTATGLPLLIYGPSYCSAVVWARENPGVAEIVESEDELAEAVERLAKDPAGCFALGKRALEIGRNYFTHEHVQRVFHRALFAQSV